MNGAAAVGPALVTIGNFDGVHRGHQHVLRQVVERARALGVGSLAITFDPHPRTVLNPGASVDQLTSVAEKEALIRAQGIDDVWVCPFTDALSRLTPEEFLALAREHRPIAELWIGADFALGRDRSGTVQVLAQIGARQGWALHVVPPFTLNGQVVSSSRIRDLLRGGDVAAASHLLGRPVALPIVSAGQAAP